MTHKEFDEHLSYQEILFTTIPGTTGIILLIIITTMCFTSLEKVRRKYFQLFATTHVICFPLFIILIVVHGSDTWLNYGFPLGSITVLLSLLLYVIFWVRKVILQCRGGFEIEKVDICENGTFCYLHIKKPKHYKMIEGQYAFLNCPAVSFWQWHPFSICSSTKNHNITFLIKNNGNFTSELIKLFKTKSSAITTNQELGETPRDSQLQDSQMPPIKYESKNTTEMRYPTINLSYPISSPAVLSKTRKSVIYIGTGAGIATFLSFIDSQYIDSKQAEADGVELPDEPDKHIDIVFISRELEHLKWIAPYIDGILRFPSMTNKMRFHIYMTLKDRGHSLPSFLFLRALTLFNMKRELVNGKANTLSLNIGRPDFNKLLNNIIKETEAEERYVYACGPKVMTDAIEKLCLDKTSNENKIIFNYEIF